VVSVMFWHPCIVVPESCEHHAMATRVTR
jgi:hypothetical protein